MGAEASLEQALHEALVHLHDPEYQPQEATCIVVGCAPGHRAETVQNTLISILTELAPADGAAGTGRGERPYEVLYARFVLQLTQEETSERLHLSLRTVQREQARGIHMLLSWLRERAELVSTMPDDGFARPSQAANWRGQLRREVGLLQRYDQDSQGRVGEVLANVIPLVQKGTTQASGSVIIEDTIPDAPVAVHPSTLRQILLMAVSALTQVGSDEAPVVIRFGKDNDRMEIIISGMTADGADAPDTALLHELVETAGASMRVERGLGRASIAIVVPLGEASTDSTIVLAVDDNPDLVSLYQSYCEGTQYEIVHVWDPRRVFEAVETHRPQILLLDVLLPGVDGWDLLLDLHANELTRDLPVIVCSVITNEDLALALGASFCLQKPVWRPQLIDAFARALKPWR